jgi:hypothetical protein
VLVAEQASESTYVIACSTPGAAKLPPDVPKFRLDDRVDF